MRWTTCAVAVLLVGVQAEAGTITQTFSVAGHGPSAFFGVYNQLDPSLEPLNAVIFTVTAYGRGNSYELINTDFMHTITFNVRVSGDLETDGGPIDIVNYTMPMTLGPGGSTAIDPINIPGPPGYQATEFTTTNLSDYIGTSTMIAFIGFQENVNVDNSAIMVVGPPQSGTNPQLIATETVTYFDGTTVPEPASLLMMSLGLAAVAVLAWRRRVAA